MKPTAGGRFSSRRINPSFIGLVDLVEKIVELILRNHRYKDKIKIFSYGHRGWCRITKRKTVKSLVDELFDFFFFRIIFSASPFDKKCTSVIVLESGAETSVTTTSNIVGCV